jgi:Tfp pilus assembly protein PilN
MRAVNLLPSDRSKSDARPGTAGSGGGGALTTPRVAIAGGALAAVVVGIVGFTFVGARGDVATKQDALTAIQQQVADAQTKAVSQTHVKQQQAASTALPTDIKAQLDAFNMVAATRVQWDLLLGDVSRVIPSGSWLSSMTLQGQTAPTTPVDGTAATATTTASTPTGFVVSGFAVSQPVVAKLLQQLALVPMLSDITLQRSDRTDVGSDSAYQFTLSANVRLDGAA